MKYLETQKDVFDALLQGKKIQNTAYCSDGNYIELSDTGSLCEEDGAGCKADRFPICMRNGEMFWVIDI